MTGWLIRTRRDIFIGYYSIVLVLVGISFVQNSMSDHARASVCLLVFIGFSIFIGTICLLIWLICNRYKGQRIALSGHTLQFSTRKSASREINISFDLTKYNAILFEHEQFEYAPGSRSNLYLIHMDNGADPLSVGNLDLLFMVNQRLLEDISRLSGLPIIRKYYILEADLNHRREIQPR
jgi:hypothetical protein